MINYIIKNKILIIIVAILILFIYEKHARNNISYPDKAFNTSKWINDSLGCSSYRKKACESVLKNESFFIGKNYKKILSILGKPTSNYKEGLESGTLYYVVECMEIPGYNGEPEKYSAKESQMLLFDMKRDTCINMSMITP